MTQNKIKDESKDKAYFIITPQLVLALSRDPYDYTLWNVIKMVAGETGECILSSPDLAMLAMMSVGKLSDCRAFLIDKGLLAGHIYQDPGYPQPVWHLSVPDLWKRNAEWREQHPSLKSLIEHKISFHLMKALSKVSPGEKGTTPGEKGTTPGETNKNMIELKEEHGCQSLWELILKDLRGTMTSSTYEMHFSQTRAVERVNGCLVVSVPNDQSQDWLQRRWNARVLRAAQAADPTLEMVRFKTAGEG